MIVNEGQSRPVSSSEVRSSSFSLLLMVLRSKHGKLKLKLCTLT